MKYLIILLLTFLFSCDFSTETKSLSATDAENECFVKINQHRQSIGKTALVWNDTIAVICRQHSENMQNGSVPFGHDGFQIRFDSLKSQLIRVTGAGENVHYNKNVDDPVKTAVDGWLNSPPHKKNIEGDFNLSAIGVSKNGDTYYFTQIFIKQTE